MTEPPGQSGSTEFMFSGASSKRLSQVICLYALCSLWLDNSSRPTTMMRSIAATARAQARTAYAASRPLTSCSPLLAGTRPVAARWSGRSPARMFHSPSAALGPALTCCRSSTSVTCAVNMCSTRSHAHHAPRSATIVLHHRTNTTQHSSTSAPSTFSPSANTPAALMASTSMLLPGVGTSDSNEQGEEREESAGAEEQGEAEAAPFYANVVKVVVWGATTYCLLEYSDIPAMFKNLPPSVLGILGVQLLVFALHRKLPSVVSFRHLYTSWEHVFVQKHVHTLFTSVFSHRALAHLAVNSFVLASFGPLVTNAVGEKDFLIFYVVAGVVSSLCGVLASGLLARAGIRELMRLQPGLGASGSTMGLIGVSAVLYPDAQLSLFGVLPWLPASTIVPLLALADSLGLAYHTIASTMPRLGHAAHLGGVAMGYLWTHTYLRWQHPHIDRFLTKRENMTWEEKQEINRKATEAARAGL